MIEYQETKLNRLAFELRPALPSKICLQPRLVIGIFRDACRKWHASVRAGSELREPKKKYKEHVRHFIVC